MAESRFGRLMTTVAFDRVLPAALFAVITTLSINTLANTWLAPIEPTFQSRLTHVLDIAHALLALLFMTMMTVLFIIRRAPVGRHAGPLSKAIAFGGTFVMWLALVQPITITDWRVLALADLLMIVGLAFSIYAFASLRTCFGIAPEARGLVTTGAYRWLRHPAYVGEFVVAFGGLLPVLAPYSTAVFALFCLLQARRAVLEEAVLTDTFSGYAVYRQRTPAFVPFLRPGVVKAGNQVCLPAIVTRFANPPG